LVVKPITWTRWTQDIGRPYPQNQGKKLAVEIFVGDGANRWPAAHRLDAARLFRLALERAEPGSRLHALAEEGIPMLTTPRRSAKG
jgi:hypothetical protein